MQTHKDSIEKIDLFDCRKRQLVLLPEQQTVCICLVIKKKIKNLYPNSELYLEFLLSQRWWKQKDRRGGGGEGAGL